VPVGAEVQQHMQMRMSHSPRPAITRAILAFLFPALACGGGNKATADASADAPADAPIAVNCSTYCDAIQANCTGDSAQYASTAQCMATCAQFTIGTSTAADTTGNTLGCRVHYAVVEPASAPDRCAHAGPGGDVLASATPAACSDGNVCARFCALDLVACGSHEAPLPGDPQDSFGPVWQYQNTRDCMLTCADYDHSPPYSSAAVGDSLACRLGQAIASLISPSEAVAHCNASGMTARPPCTGSATP